MKLFIFLFLLCSAVIANNIISVILIDDINISRDTGIIDGYLNKNETIIFNGQYVIKHDTSNKRIISIRWNQAISDEQTLSIDLNTLLSTNSNIPSYSIVKAKGDLTTLIKLREQIKTKDLIKKELNSFNQRFILLDEKVNILMQQRSNNEPNKLTFKSKILSNLVNQYIQTKNNQGEQQ